MENCIQGEGMIAVNKKKNMAVVAMERARAKAKISRRVLGDIGNWVAPLPEITPAVTRSFRSQLIADPPENWLQGEGKIIVNKQKNLAVVAMERAREKAKISRGGLGARLIADPESNNKPGAMNVERRKKTQPSLTSAMTARSMAFCGLDSKPKLEQVAEIDALDVDNELAVVEYVEDIYKFYKSVEDESRAHDYMPSQREITGRMRAIVIDWLIEVHQRFKLADETLYLTINIIDRFLAAEPVLGKELQCLGMSAMLIASKYEDVWPPAVNDFVLVSDRAYDHQQVLVMEKRILGKLEWKLTVPTTYVFLARFIKASSNPVDPNMENMVYFLAELGMRNYDTIRYWPSMVAASAVYAARCTLNKSPLWNGTLKLHTGYSESQGMC